MRKRGRPRLGLDLGRLLQLRGQGKTLREIATEFGVGKTSIGDTLKMLSEKPQDETSPPEPYLSQGGSVGVGVS